ncbi:MAG: HAMP domain-containing histidine kinase [Pelatocladus maniniholoensis HA4357-MV3]|uniref:histidine kinase n=1 Tax=Pelatocladus maniniholoensis HA4357-MV3 TaxID=1117104 RepID=A0A9E3HCE5_9NOST|nr:HAMP domain-containing histidine kinase [Pelatocladus maniniholoensis HA4357-MV3]
MNWSNWVDLGAGLLLGLGIAGLLARINRPSSSSPVLPAEKQDVVKLQQQIKQTQLAYEMAREMSQFKAGYLARTTHVLRSPINGLIGLQQLILANLCEDPEEEREFIKQAHDRTLKLLKLIDEILTVARLEHGTNKLDLQPRSLTELLQEVYDLTYMLAENRNFPFKVLLPESDLKVVVDSRWFKQVLINLIESAIAQIEEGNIYISSQTSSTDNFVYVWLDVPKQGILHSEPIDLISSKNQVAETEEENITFDPGMKFLLNQTILGVMGGNLEIVPFSLTTQQAEDMARLQITIPQFIS